MKLSDCLRWCCWCSKPKKPSYIRLDEEKDEDLFNEKDFEECKEIAVEIFKDFPNDIHSIYILRPQSNEKSNEYFTVNVMNYGGLQDEEKIDTSKLETQYLASKSLETHYPMEGGIVLNIEESDKGQTLIQQLTNVGFDSVRVSDSSHSHIHASFVISPWKSDFGYTTMEKIRNLPNSLETLTLTHSSFSSNN